MNGPIRRIPGRAVLLPGDDIDTDRIIPARFLKCVTFDGLGAHLLRDERFDAEGFPRPHPLNEASAAGARILVVGRNFGCGSSREHAPQAIARAGFRALVGLSFAEIFAGNATALGLPCARLSPADHEALRAQISASPRVELQVDLEGSLVAAGEKTWPLHLPEATRRALLTGRWDPLAQLRENLPEARAVHARLAYTRGSRDG